jgi:hypothetical protein
MKSSLSSRRQLWLATFALALGLAPASAGELVLEPTFDGGDAVGELKKLQAVLSAEPADPRVPILLGALSRRQSLVPNAYAGLRETLSAALPEAGWNQDPILVALAGLSERLGDRKAAEAFRVQRGLLRQFLVCGPFGIAPSASLDRTFPPEVAANSKTFSLEQRFEGMRREPRPWAELRPERPGRIVSPGSVLDGSGQVLYALTHVRYTGQAPAKAWLVYRGPSARIWCNRELASKIDRNATRLPSKVRVELTLRPGWNRILFKVVGGPSARFSAQLCEESGAPLVLEESLQEAVEPGVAGVKAPRPRASLEALASEQDPERVGLYAWSLANEGLSEEALLTLEKLEATATGLRNQTWYQLLYARIAAEANHLPPVVRRNRAREACEKALRLTPGLREAELRLASFELADDKTLPAVKRLEALLEARPRDLWVRLLLGAALLGQGWELPFQDVLEGTPKEQRGLAPVLQMRIRLLNSQGRREETLPIQAQVYALDKTQTAVLQGRLAQALARGDQATATATQATLDEANGASAQDRALSLRGLARSLGQRARALAALRTWVDAKADSRQRRLALADRLAQDAEQNPAARKEAITILEQILRESPGLHAALRLLEGLTGKEDAFWEAWEPKIDEVLASAPDAKTWPKANRVCLFDQTVTKIYPDTSSTDVVHQVWRMLDEGGKQALGERPNAGETLVIRTITPDGKRLEPIDANTGKFQMPGLRPGASVEHSYRVRRGPAGFQFENGPFYFMDPDLQEPFWLSRWVVIVHEKAPVEIIERNLNRKGITHEVTTQGEWKTHVFTARHQPRVEPEPSAPGRRELLPWIRVIETKTLDDLDGLYRERALRGRAPAPSVEAKAKELLDGVDGDQARADKLLAFVHEHVTSPGRGDDPARVLASRRGNKSSLYRALLRAAKVPHALAFASQSPHARTRTDWSVPELGQFGIPIVRIAPRGGEPYYVLPNADRLADRRRLPVQLWGAPVYVSAEEGGFLEVLPEGKLEDESTRTRLRLTLDERGGGRILWRQELRSFGYFRLKSQISATPAQRLRGFFAGQISRQFPGANLVRFATPSVEEVGVPVRWKVEANSPQVLAKRPDGTFRLGSVIAASQVGARYGAHRVRRFALVFDEPTVLEDSTEVLLGPYACPHLPQELRINRRLLQYSFRATRPAPDRVRIERRLVIRRGRIQPAEYERFRQQLQRIDAAEQAGLVLEKRAK